jgi:hypothetical protein
MELMSIIFKDVTISTRDSSHAFASANTFSHVAGVCSPTHYIFNLNGYKHPLKVLESELFGI